MAIRHTYGTIDQDYAIRLGTTPPDEDGPILMVNLMKYHERAEYTDGDRGISGKEADDRYSPVKVLRDIGAEVQLFGDVDQQLLGAAPIWDRVACVQYPTRRSFIEMQARRDFQEKHEHKAAGMSETIIMGCLPIELPAGAEALSTAGWADVPHPPTPEDGPVVVVHVIRFSDAEREKMTTYTDHASPVATEHGVVLGGWYRVEGTIVGDGRQWDQVRFNVFPSKRAFMAVVLDPARLEAQKAFREPAMADTYTMIVRAGINSLPGMR